MIKNIDSLADRLKGIKYNGEDITPEKFLELQSSEEEVDLEVSEASLFTDDELSSMKEKIENDNKSKGYSEGKEAGAEMTIKELKRKWGIETEGKTVETLYKNVNDKIKKDAQIPEQQRVQELEESLERIRGEWSNEVETIKKEKEQLEGTVSKMKTETQMIKNMPKIEGYKSNHLLAAYRADGYDLSQDENGNAFVKTPDGKPLKNRKEEYIPFQEHFAEWATESGYMKVDGRGEGNRNGQYRNGKYKNKEEAFKYMKEQNIDPDSKQGEEVLQQVAEQE